MELRQKLYFVLILVLTLFAFASYHSGTGSTAWMQWATVVMFLIFGLAFDLTFTNDSEFVFDPDADNWRRKTEGVY